MIFFEFYVIWFFDVVFDGSYGCIEVDFCVVCLVFVLFGFVVCWQCWWVEVVVVDVVFVVFFMIEE